MRKTDLVPLHRPRGHSEEPRHWKAGSWKASSAVRLKAACVSLCSIINLWQSDKTQATHRHGNLVGFMLNCLEAILLREQTGPRIKGSLSFHGTQDEEHSLWNVGHNSLAVRCGGAKAEGPVFSLTLSSLMTNTWIFTGANGSYLVMAVDTGHYWAHRQSRADTGVSVWKFWRRTTATFQTTLEQLVYNTIPLCAIFYWQSCIITRVLEWMQLINSFPYTYNLRFKKLCLVYTTAHNHCRYTS